MVESKTEEREETEKKKDGMGISDYENAIIEDFFAIETLAASGAKMFDNAGNTSAKANLHGTNFLTMIEEKLIKIGGNLELQMELIDAREADDGK